MPAADETTKRGVAAGMLDIDELTFHAACRGDPGACTRFVAAYERRVFAAISRILGPHGRGNLVEDVAQETFLRALRALPRFRVDGAGKLSTWLLTIATRQALGELRRRDLLQGHEAAETVEHVDAVEHARADDRRDLQQAIAALTAEQRAVFVLRDVHGLTETEVAAALEIDVSAVKSRLFRARARLRKFLQSSEPG